MVIDIHGHFVPAAVLSEVRQHPQRFPDIASRTTPEGLVSLRFPGLPWTRPVASGLTDLDRRRRWMREAGVDRQLFLGWADLAGYTLPAEQGADWCRLYNQAMAEAIAGHPEFVGVSVVPLQDPARAAAEALHCREQWGFPAVLIATQIAGRELDDPAFDPFFGAMAEAGLPVIMHPGWAGSEERMAAYGLANAVGRAAETTLAVTRMMFGGVFERHPRLTLVLVHGGGYLPYQAGRLARAFAIGEFPRTAGRNPAQVLRQLYYDSLVFAPASLRFLVDQVGADHCMVGSDFPFAIGDPDPAGVVRACPLTEPERAAITWRTAATLFGLDVDDRRP